MHDCGLPTLHAQAAKAGLPSQKPSMHSAAVTWDRPARKPLGLWWISLSCLLALQACTASPPGSRAEPGPRARPANAEARDHLDRGNRLFRVHQVSQAIEAYEAGILLEDAPLFHFNLGQSFRKISQYEKALWHYDRFARHVPAGDPDRPVIEALIAQTRGQSLSAAAAPPPAPPASAERVNESPPPPAAADPGTPSRTSPTRRTTGSSVRRASPPAKEPAGELAVMVTPWAAVWLNGKSLSGGTPSRTKLPAGRHRIRIANDDLGRRETLTVTIKSNETTTIERTW